MSIDRKKITDIVDSNYVNASVLYYFGISFYEYSEKTLEQVCEEKGLNVKTVIKRLESINQTGIEDQPVLSDYPVDLIIEYLKHTHYIFIKQRLPYLAKLIEGLSGEDLGYTLLEKDLKFVFPLFVEDFIHHIYQEEDSLFDYILRINSFLNKKGNWSKVYYDMESHSLQRYAMEHDEHDDEMNGIRRITNQYKTQDNTPLHLRVVFAELKALEAELITHASIENNILFPKALQLEKEARLKIQSTIKLN